MLKMWSSKTDGVGDNDEVRKDVVDLDKERVENDHARHSSLLKCQVEGNKRGG